MEKVCRNINLCKNSVSLLILEENMLIPAFLEIHLCEGVSQTLQYNKQ